MGTVMRFVPTTLGVMLLDCEILRRNSLNGLQDYQPQALYAIIL